MGSQGSVLSNALQGGGGLGSEPAGAPRAWARGVREAPERDYGRARPAPQGFGTLGVPRAASSTLSEQVGGAERLPRLDRKNLGVPPASPWPW